MNPKQFKLFYKHAGGKGGRYWSLIFHSFKNPFPCHFYFLNLGSRTSSFQCNANTSSLCPLCLLCPWRLPHRVLPRPGRVHGPRADWGRSPGKHAWIPARCSAGAFKQISHFRNLFPLKLSIASIFPLNRAAALPLSLGLALLPPFRVWALAWQKHRWRITKNILKSQRACSRWTTGWGRLSSARMEMEKLDSGWKPSTKVPPDLAQDCFHLCRAGVFVCLVTKGSPAALGGLRFGDQLLQVDGVNLAGFSSDKVRYYLSTYKASLLHCTMHIVRCTTCWKRPRWTT